VQGFIAPTAHPKAHRRATEGPYSLQPLKSTVYHLSGQFRKPCTVAAPAASSAASLRQRRCLRGALGWPLTNDGVRDQTGAVSVGRSRETLPVVATRRRTLLCKGTCSAPTSAHQAPTGIRKVTRDICNLPRIKPNRVNTTKPLRMRAPARKLFVLIAGIFGPPRTRAPEKLRRSSRRSRPTRLCHRQFRGGQKTAGTPRQSVAPCHAPQTLTNAFGLIVSGVANANGPITMPPRPISKQLVTELWRAFRSGGFAAVPSDHRSVHWKTAKRVGIDRGKPSRLLRAASGGRTVTTGWRKKGNARGRDNQFNRWQKRDEIAAPDNRHTKGRRARREVKWRRSFANQTVIRSSGRQARCFSDWAWANRRGSLETGRDFAV